MGKKRFKHTVKDGGEFSPAIKVLETKAEAKAKAAAAEEKMKNFALGDHTSGVIEDSEIDFSDLDAQVEMGVM